MEIKTPKRRQPNNLQSPVLRPEKSKPSFLQQSQIFIIIIMCTLDNNICIVDVTPC